MADGESTISILDRLSEDYLTCTICHDRYSQPKILNCLHSFCEKCLLQYQPSEGPVKIICPVCRRETATEGGGVAWLRSNFHLRGLVEAFQQQEERLAGRSGNERSTPAIEECSSPPALRVLNCRKHTDEKTWFYCESCQELICRVCTIKTHLDHTFDEIDTAAESCRESLRENLPRVEGILSGVEGSLEINRHHTRLVSSLASASRQKLEEHTTNVVAIVMRARQRILDEISATETEREAKFKDQTKRLTMLRDNMKHSLTISDQLITDATDIDLLSMYSILKNDLKGYTGTDPQQVQKQHEMQQQQQQQQPPFMKFLPCANPLPSVNLGKLLIDTENWKATKRIGRKGISLGHKDDFNAARGIAVSSNDGCGDIAVADRGMWTKGITILTTQWEHKASIRFQDNPRDVVFANGSIVVVDDTDTVKVYTLDMNLAFDFITTCQRDSEPVNIVSVAAKPDGTIVVGDVRRSVLTEHLADNGAILRTVPTKVPPFFLAVNRAGRVLVSGLDTGEIEAIDGDGSAVLTVFPVVAGEKVSCRGVCYDNEGNFYVVVHGKNSNLGHIHQCSSEGEFIGCVVRDLYDPNGITLITRGELAVADCFSVKVFNRVDKNGSLL